VLLVQPRKWMDRDPDNHTASPRREPTEEVTIMTYNLMAESSASSFKSRFELIVRALSLVTVTSSKSTSLKVLCLQEINNDMLQLVLSEPFIQTNFPFSTHMLSSILPSHRNLVTLATVPFTYFLLPFLERHKTALIIVMGNSRLEVANVHLTSALSNEAVEAKWNQMTTLTKFLNNDRTAGKEVLMAGDFNLTTSSHTIETALSRKLITPRTKQMITEVIDPDIWEDAFSFCPTSQADNEELFEGEEGATFDRLTNHLAATSESPVDNRPQRYDRILFKKGGSVAIENLENFGFPTDGRRASDHYGTCVTLRIETPDNTTTDAKIRDSDLSGKRSNTMEVVEDSTDLRDLIEPYLPTQADREQRQEAISLLRQRLMSDKSMSDIVFAPLGSQCMDTYFPDSDIDLLVIGSVRPKVCFEFAATELRAPDNSFKGVHFVNSLVSIIEIHVMGIKFDLQYCQAAELVTRYHSKGVSADLSTIVFDSQLISSLSPSSIRPLNTYRDTTYILHSVPDLPSYRIAHRYLSLYLKRRGLYSAKFGYLGGIHLSLMLNRILKLIDNDCVISHATIVRMFFRYYAGFDWGQDNVTDPSLPSHRNVLRSPRDSILIYSIHTPTARPNVASSCTRLSAQTLTHEFNVAAEKLQLGDWEWCLRPAVSDFSNGFGAFIRVEVDVWNVDEIGGDKLREMIGSLESKFPRIMVSLGRVDGSDGRIWPVRFRSKDVEKKEQFKGYYLIGVSACEEGIDDQKKRQFTSKVITAIGDFEEFVRGSEAFQGGNVWIAMDLVPKRKILDSDLMTDERECGSVEGQVTEPAPQVPAPAATATVYTSPHQRSSSASLRPAQDIISRIHWDPAMSVDDFVIGYEDRFVGVKEIPLGKWKSEQTDEEFIPRHRIVWVRRKAEGGEKVWDRRKRVDLIFGSGVSD
jgi:uncharacterized protein (UPF0248 family)/endonuclease/exonuclease/phosphatase family metal-dependent hydrolase